MELVEHPASRAAFITPQAFRSVSKCSDPELRAIAKLMSATGRTRDSGSTWDMDQAFAELQILRLQTRKDK